jgi:hypothetical protein
MHTSSLLPTLPKEADPNACLLLQQLRENYASIQWQDDPIALAGFTSVKPWKEDETDLSDQELISKMCSRLVSLTTENLRPHLDQVTLVLLFALCSHTLRENVRFRNDFKNLAKRFLPFLESFLKTPPVEKWELEQYKNFCRLYHFFVGCKFLTRLEEEERYKPTWEKMERERKGEKLAPTKERFSLWGNSRVTGTFAGITKKQFDLSDLLSSLEDVRQVALHESRRRKETQEASLESLFTVTPITTRKLSPRMKSFLWADLFHESTGNAQREWIEGQKTALQYAQQLESEFNHLSPPLHFISIVQAAQQGREALNKLLGTYSDKGFVLLRDYIYPYVVLMKRATTSFEHVSRKFIAGSASPEEVLSLCEEDEATYVVVLQNVLSLMRTDGEVGPGGVLKDSVIHSSQIAMLSQMIRCIQSGKPAFICNETGSGKTTMSKLAPQIVSFHVPVVLHVAPFTQSEKGWERLSSWETLSKVNATKTSHFWITASELSRLMAKGVPPEYLQLLKKSFFLMDEYDSQEYMFTSRDEDDLETVTSIQDELFFRYSCPRVVNMSATPNLETFATLLDHYRKKIEGTEKPDVKEHYVQKITTITKQREELLSSIALEWQRHITLRDLPRNAEKNPILQISTVFEDIKGTSFDSSKGTSLLVEVPEFTLTPEYASVLQTHMKNAFGASPSALLFRDSDGFVQAHTTTDGTTWRVVSLEDFAREYLSLEKKPIVVCFYSQDSVGGDFDIFSNERLVRGQYIIYSEKMAPSYAIFQNMRRQRRNLSGQVALRERTPSETPVTFYLGQTVSSHLPLSSSEEEGIKSLDAHDQQQALNQKRKAYPCCHAHGC